MKYRLWPLAFIFCLGLPNVLWGHAPCAGFVDVTAIRQSWPSYGEALVNFRGAMERLNLAGAFDSNSVCVVQLDDEGGAQTNLLPARFIPASDFDAKSKPVGRVVWLVPGDGLATHSVAVDEEGFVIDKATKARHHRFTTGYRIYFDVKGALHPPPLATNGIPDRGEIFPNGGFEVTSAPGVPRDLSLFRAKINSLDETVFHTGRQSLRLNPPSDQTAPGLTAGFGEKFLRVEPGRNYTFGFWARALGTDSCIANFAALWWCDGNGVTLKDAQGKSLPHMTITDRSADFDWTYAELMREAPTQARFAYVYFSTWTKVGHVWLDDITAWPQVLPDDPLEAARIKIETTTYPDLALLQDVSGEFVTPHVKWMKPAAVGPVKTLYLAQMYLDTDGNARNVIEFAQRMELDWTFLPVLKGRRMGNNFYHIENNDDIEPYTLESLKSRLKTTYDVIAVDRVDFKGVQKEFGDLLLGAAAQGVGVLFIDCLNLPTEITSALAQKLKPPPHFSLMPHINPEVKRSACGRLVMALYENGRLASLSRAEKFYPCVLHGQTGYTVDLQAKAFPGWEYQFIPWLKTLLWLANKPAKASVVGVDYDGAELKVRMEGGIRERVAIEVVVRDPFGRVSASNSYPMATAGTSDSGTGVVSAVVLPPLPDGMHVAEYRLRDATGKVLDFGAKEFVVAATGVMGKLRTDKRTIHGAEPVTVIAELSAVPLGANLVVEILDVYDRILSRQSLALTAGQPTAQATFTVPQPLSIIHRAFARVCLGDRILSERMVEFSTPDNHPKDDEYSAYFWPGAPMRAPGYFMALKQAGFENILLEPGRMAYAGNPIVHAGLRTWGYSVAFKLGSLTDANGDKTGIRNPCFSDPAFWKKAEELRKYGPDMAYYGIRDFQLCDELQFGAIACFCPHCLEGLRDYLKTIYPDLAALNRKWGTDFIAWDEVKPYTLKETKEKNKPISSWLDHKMFMTMVFARMVEHFKTLFQPYIPDVKMGLSGTQNPGLTYHWSEFLKYAESVGNYGGIQGDLIRSFKRPGSRIGRWTGGYALPWKHAEKYARNAPWAGLFDGSPCYFFFHGGCFGMRGDLRMNANTKIGLEEFAIVQGGVDKLLLSTPRRDDGIVIHYSHASCLAALAGKNPQSWSGALDGWKFMLDDLGLNFRFVSSEQVEAGALGGGSCKVIILPVSYCLSGKEIEGLAAFAQAGGTIIADYAPGLFDEHGGIQTNPELMKLFGIERTGADVKILEGDLVMGDAPSVGAKPRTLKLRYADEALKLTTGKPLAQFADKPALIVNAVGKGKTILLNCVMHDYAKSALMGGGETEVIGRGDIAFTTPLREMLGDLLAGIGIRPVVTLATKKGVNFQPLSQTVVYDAGAARYIGLLKSDMACEPIRPEERVPVEVDVGMTGYLYDVRTGKYLGQGRKAELVMAPSIGQVLAVLPYRVKGVTVSVVDLMRGETLTANITIQAAGSLGTHGVFVRFLDPAGNEALHYRTKAIVAKGQGTVAIPTALNDAVGSWTVQVTDIASGVTGQAKVRMR